MSRYSWILNFFKDDTSVATEPNESYSKALLRTYESFYELRKANNKMLSDLVDKEIESFKKMGRGYFRINQKLFTKTYCGWITRVIHFGSGYEYAEKTSPRDLFEKDLNDGLFIYLEGRYIPKSEITEAWFELSESSSNETT